MEDSKLQTVILLSNVDKKSMCNKGKALGGFPCQVKDCRQPFNLLIAQRPGDHSHEFY